MHLLAHLTMWGVLCFFWRATNLCCLVIGNVRSIFQWSPEHMLMENALKLTIHCWVILTLQNWLSWVYFSAEMGQVIIKYPELEGTHKDILPLLFSSPTLYALLLLCFRRVQWVRMFNLWPHHICHIKAHVSSSGLTVILSF